MKDKRQELHELHFVSGMILDVELAELKRLAGQQDMARLNATALKNELAGMCAPGGGFDQTTSFTETSRRFELRRDWLRREIAQATQQVAKAAAEVEQQRCKAQRAFGRVEALRLVNEQMALRHATQERRK